MLPGQLPLLLDPEPRFPFGDTLFEDVRSYLLHAKVYNEHKGRYFSHFVSLTAKTAKMFTLMLLCYAFGVVTGTTKTLLNIKIVNSRLYYDIKLVRECGTLCTIAVGECIWKTARGGDGLHVGKWFRHILLILCLCASGGFIPQQSTD